MRDTQLPECACPDCGGALNAALDPKGRAVPEPGDVTVCIHCYGICVFADDLTLREPTEEELLDLPPEVNEYQHLLKHIDEAAAQPLWTECEMCGEYWCNLHQQHAHDCACPDIDAFAELNIWPYAEGSRMAYSKVVGMVIKEKD